MIDFYNALKSKAGVIGVGYGFKYKNGQPTGELGLVVNVSEKKPKTDLALKDRIPDVMDGYLTDVIPSGVVSAYPLTGIYRPLIPGASIGHKDITAGSTGAIVSLNNLPAVLSNNHVLANSNNANLGDRIDQPGPYDQSVLPPGDYRVGELAKFVPIKFVGDIVGDCQIAQRFVRVVNYFLKFFGRKTRIRSYLPQEEMFNLVDAALAYLDMNIDAVPELNVDEVAGAELGDRIKKVGRTTELTSGIVTQVQLTISVQYGEGKIAVFQDQFASDSMTSEPGDSGSGVFAADSNKNILKGLLFAGSDQITVCNQAYNVKEALDFGG